MKHISIALRIALGLIIIILMFITVNVVTYNKFSSLHDDAQEMEHAHDDLMKIELVLSNLKDAEIGQRGYLITGMDKYLEPYNNAIKNIPLHLKELKEFTIYNQMQQQRIAELELLIDKKFDELKKTIDLRNELGFEVAQQEVITDKGKVIMDDIRLLLEKMTSEEQRLLDEGHIKSEHDSVVTKRLTVGLTILACFLVIIMILTYVKIISAPIKKLSSIADKIALGDLSAKIEVTDSRNEIGVLTRSFSTMQQNLLKKAQQAQEIAKRNLTINVTPLSDKDTLGIAFESMVKHLNTEMKEINDGTSILTSTSSQIMAMISQLASTSAETAASVSETTTTIEEVKQTAEISVQKANEVAETTQGISTISKEGEESVVKTIEGMKRIKQQMESIATIVIQLSEKSNAIGEIANNVSDLAEQSNLLAVNASIEAAKAGEHGKGFAVVAQEIKNLASRSKGSTLQIRTILSDIQKEISNAVMATEQGGKVIEAGLELSSSSQKVISTLASGVEQTSEANIHIAASSQQQLTGMDQISLAMEDIKQASQQATDGSLQAETAVTELKKLGETLVQMLQQFKLN